MLSVAGGVVCGRVRQCVAVCCCVLLCVFGVGCIALESYFWYAEYCSVMSYVAVCCSVLQCAHT